MNEEQKKVFFYFVDQPGRLITLVSVIVTLITSANILWKIAVNYIKSMFYGIDFQLFQVSFDFYQFILHVFLYLTVFAIFKSVKTTFNYFWKLKLKKREKVPFLLLFCFFLFLFVTILFVTSSFSFSFILNILFCGCFLNFFFWLCWKITTFDGGKEIVNKEDRKITIHNILYLFACLFFVEAILCFFLTSDELLNKKTYYIIPDENHDVVNVVIETYHDYYILKEAGIDNGKLIINKNSQRLGNVNDCYAYLEIFNDIVFE